MDFCKLFSGHWSHMHHGVSAFCQSALHNRSTVHCNRKLISHCNTCHWVRLANAAHMIHHLKMIRGKTGTGKGHRDGRVGRQEKEDGCKMMMMDGCYSDKRQPVFLGNESNHIQSWETLRSGYVSFISLKKSCDNAGRVIWCRIAYLESWLGMMCGQKQFANSQIRNNSRIINNTFLTISTNQTGRKIRIGETG